MRETLRQLFGNRNAVIGLIIVTAAIVSAVACHLLSPFDPEAQFRDYCRVEPGTKASFGPEDKSPNTPDELSIETRRTFLMGTDVNGRDVFSRVLYGARISMLVGVVATMINLVIGVIIGLFAGYYGKWLDAVLMRLTDTFFSFPGMLLAIIIMATFNQDAVREKLVMVSGGMDPNLWGLFIALGVTGWTGVARVIRGQVLALKEQEFIEGARAIGCSDARIIFIHLLPNCVAPIIVLGTMQVAYNILSEAGLSFLGLGVQPPAASWGGMLSEGRQWIVTMPWWSVFPGLALAITVLGFNLFGDGLRDVLDPRLKIRT